MTTVIIPVTAQAELESVIETADAGGHAGDTVEIDLLNSITAALTGTVM